MDDKPVMVLPKLAEAIGLNEAIVIQQIHYWLITFQEANKEEHFRDGRWWIYNSKKEWKDNFPWWSENTIWRSLIALREMGLVITSDEYNKKEYDKTLWYSIDYEKLNEIEEELITKMGTTRYQNGNDPLPKWERQYQRLTQRLHTKILQLLLTTSQTKIWKPQKYSKRTSRKLECSLLLRERRY